MWQTSTIADSVCSLFQADETDFEKNDTLGLLSYPLRQYQFDEKFAERRNVASPIIHLAIAISYRRKRYIAKLQRYVA